MEVTGEKSDGYQLSVWPRAGKVLHNSPEKEDGAGENMAVRNKKRTFKSRWTHVARVLLLKEVT